MKLTIICMLLFISLSQAIWNWPQIKIRVHPTFVGCTLIVDSRIVGGQEAIPHQFPHQAALLINTTRGTFFCGGSLISVNYVLTAAHCVDKTNAVEVVLGAHNIRQNEPSQQRLTAKTIKVHPQWDPFVNENDIALLELSEAAILNDDIQLISLPSNSEVVNSFFGESVTASGWGRDSDQATTVSDVLRSVKSTNICTSGFGGKSTCNGDSGGPLVIGNKQIGIVSFGIIFGCEKNWPAVFTRVTSYLDWIAQNSDATIN